MARYPVTSALVTNSLCGGCCKPTAHCNKALDHGDLLEKLRVRRDLRPVLQRLANEPAPVLPLRCSRPLHVNVPYHRSDRIATTVRH